jgi:hypothetical protein
MVHVKASYSLLLPMRPAGFLLPTVAALALATCAARHPSPSPPPSASVPPPAPPLQAPLAPPATPLAVALGLAEAAQLGGWLSGQELARLLVVAPGTVRSWSTGHHPRPGFELERRKDGAPVWWTGARL